MSLEIRDCLPFATSLLGAFFGALGAYWVGRFKEKRDETNRRHNALLATQYALNSQWSIVEDIRRTLLEPLRNDPDRYLALTYFYRVPGELRVPFDELAFIIDTKDANLLQEIHVSEKRFLSAVYLLDEVNRLRRTLEEKHPPQNFDMATGRGLMVAPMHEVFDLKAVVDLLYQEVDEALPDLRKANEKIFAFTKKYLIETRVIG